MRVMLDTNVLISAVIFPTARMDALIYKAAVDHQMVLSSYIVEELIEVTRRKFPAKVKDMDLFLTRLPYELVYAPKEPPSGLFTIRDAKDYPALYTAIVENIDIFVTGDDDFNGVEIERPEIISPAAFLER